MSAPRLDSFDVKIASSLAARFRLRDVIVAGLEAKMLTPPAEDGGDFSFDMPRADVRWIREGTELKVVLPYQVDIRQDGKHQRTLAQFRVLLRVDYQVAPDDPVTEDELQHFVGISAFMHSWPYLREEITTLTTKLRFPPLVLPVVVSGNADERLSVSAIAGPDAVSDPNVAMGVSPSFPELSGATPAVATSAKRPPKKRHARATKK